MTRLLWLLATLAIVASASSEPASDLYKLSRVVGGASGLECEFCKFFVRLANDVVDSKITIEIAEEAAIAFCKINGGGLGYKCEGTWACDDVCGGAVHEFAPVVFRIASLKYFDPEADCVYFHACKANTTSRTLAVDTRPSTTRVATPARTPSQLSRFAAMDGIVRILQVTDIHFQPDYETGRSTDCGEPNCCRKVGPVGATSNTSAGVYGDYNCDVPPPLMSSLMDELAAIRPPPDLVLLTGDDPDHAIWNQSQSQNTGRSIAIAKMFQSALPNSTTIPCLGNHNGFPVNVFVTGSYEEDQEWLYKPLSVAYGPWLSPSAAAQFAQAGFFTMSLPRVGTAGNLRTIVLNTNFHDSANLWLHLGESDFAGMMKFFTDTLASARAAGERVYVLAHHHPLSVTEAYSNWFYSVMGEYGDIVVGVFHGHTHDDDFGVFRAANGTGAPLTAFYIPAAVCTGVNPTYRIYYANATTGDIYDYDNFRVDLRRQGLLNNQDASHRPVWEHAYTATTAFNMTTTSPAEWLRVAELMKTDDALFTEWYTQYTTGKSSTYTPSERKERICSMLYPSSALNAECLSKPLV